MKQINRFKQYGLTGLALAGLLNVTLAQAGFDSGSDGSDGALVLDTPGTFLFDKAAFSPELDADGDGVFHFTSITIAAGVTVTFSQGPVVWLASGDVLIDGIVDLSGSDGRNADQGQTNSVPGPGGFSGGMGETLLTPAQSGFGPGGGRPDTTSSWRNGGGGGYFVNGVGGLNTGDTGGLAYGNEFVLPMIGGSGGAGGGWSTPDDNAGGGGAGGGAILIAVSGTTEINGSILANGGNGGSDDTLNGFDCGGGGSGGAIRIVSQELIGNGSIAAHGGIPIDLTGSNTCDTQGLGSPGRIRLESFQNGFNGNVESAFFTSTPGTLFLTADASPVRVVSIGGELVPDNPSGGLNPADITINETGETLIEIEAHGIPLGTVVSLTLLPEAGEQITADSSPLAGTEEASTATANIVIPHGFTRFYVKANWTP